MFAPWERLARLSECSDLWENNCPKCMSCLHPCVGLHSHDEGCAFGQAGWIPREGRAHSKDEHSCCTMRLFRTPPEQFPEQELAGWKPQKAAFSGSPTLMIFTRMTSQAMRPVEDWYALKLWFLLMKEIKGIKTEDRIWLRCQHFSFLQDKWQGEEAGGVGKEATLGCTR